MCIRDSLLAEREKNAALREDNTRLQSEAVYYDLFIDLHHSTNLRTTAKELDCLLYTSLFLSRLRDAEGMCAGYPRT